MIQKNGVANSGQWGNAAALMAAPFASTSLSPVAEAQTCTGGAGSSDSQVYVRYDGDVGSGTDNHALSAGLRLRY